MKVKFVALLLLSSLFISLLPTALAEHEWDHRYTISGTIVDINGDIARGVTIEIDCSEGKTTAELCELNEEKSTSANFGGEFEFALHLHSSDHGKIIVFLIDGEEFNHTISLIGDNDTMEEGDRFVSMDIKLKHEFSLFGYFLPYIIIIAIVVIGFLMLIKNKKMLFFKKAPNFVANEIVRNNLIKCPKCETQLKKKNIVKHLKSRHYLKEKEAIDLAADLDPGSDD